MPLTRKEDITELTQRRHGEWQEHQKHWRFLFDSLEGGQRYKHADYYVSPNAVETFGKAPVDWFNNVGVDPATSEIYPISYGQVVDRNLIPHLSETSPGGRELYAMRLARTPVVPVLEQKIEAHLSRVYAREVRRDGPPALLDWWLDVDGKGTPVDRWMRETVAPLLLALGQLDVCFDHPAPPEGAAVRTRADEAAYGVDGCVASVILPENLVWWRLAPGGARYAEILVVERCEGAVFYRHTDAAESNAYSPGGELLPALSRKNPFGRVPVVRLFDRRKARCGNVGKSRYDGIAQYMKAFYNGLSELILADVTQSSAVLMGPEDFFAENGSVKTGPADVLPMRKVTSGASTTYQGWAYLDPPKGAQQELRTHLLDLLDWADRDAGTSKPAGQAGGQVTAQSGVSKVMDQIDGNALLSDRAAVGEGAELVIAEFALCVLGGGAVRDADLDAVSVLYPKQFDLDTAGDVAQNLSDIQSAATRSGALPTVEGALIKKLAQLSQPGLPDDEQKAQNKEIDAYVSAPARREPGGGDDADEGGELAPAFDQAMTGTSD